MKDCIFKPTLFVKCMKLEQIKTVYCRDKGKILNITIVGVLMRFLKVLAQQERPIDRFKPNLIEMDIEHFHHPHEWRVTPKAPRPMYKRMLTGDVFRHPIPKAINDVCRSELYPKKHFDDIENKYSKIRYRNILAE